MSERVEVTELEILREVFVTEELILLVVFEMEVVMEDFAEFILELILFSRILSLVIVGEKSICTFTKPSKETASTLVIPFAGPTPKTKIKNPRIKNFPKNTFCLILSIFFSISTKILYQQKDPKWG